jgi:RHS repeat-associated protein
VTWDHDGNRLTYQGVTYTYNMDDSIATAGSTTFTYFPTGARRTDGSHFYCYDGYDRLFRATTVTDVGCNSPTISYAYEGLDRQRAHSEGSGTTFIEYEGLSSTISEEYLGGSPSGSGTVYALAGSRRTAVGSYASGGVQSSSINYLADDGMGNISTAVTTGGSMACTAWSDAWGMPMSAITSSNPCNTGSTLDTSFYTGSRRDQITGDYQFGVRTYDPNTGSFLEPDTYLGSQPSTKGSVVSDPLTLNRYIYVNGDPLNLIDPSGHITCRRGNPDPNCDIYIDGGGASTPTTSSAAAIVPYVDKNSPGSRNNYGAIESDTVAMNAPSSPDDPRRVPGNTLPCDKLYRGVPQCSLQPGTGCMDRFVDPSGICDFVNSPPTSGSPAADDTPPPSTLIAGTCGSVQAAAGGAVSIQTCYATDGTESGHVGTTGVGVGTPGLGASAGGMYAWAPSLDYLSGPFNYVNCSFGVFSLNVFWGTSKGASGHGQERPVEGGSLEAGPAVPGCQGGKNETDVNRSR